MKTSWPLYEEEYDSQAGPHRPAASTTWCGCGLSAAAMAGDPYDFEQVN